MVRSMRWRTAIGLAGLLAIWLIFSSIASAQPFPPSRFWGTLTISGEPAQEGVEITAFVDGTECGKGRIVGRADGIDGTLYAVDVLHSGQVSGCGEQGKEVTFQVLGQQVEQKGTWDNTNFVRLDISVQGPPRTALPGSENGAAPQTAEDDEGGGFPTWVIPVVAGAVVLAGIGAFMGWTRLRRPPKVE
jgi:hypothetical protein